MQAAPAKASNTPNVNGRLNRPAMTTNFEVTGDCLEVFFDFFVADFKDSTILIHLN